MLWHVSECYWKGDRPRLCVLRALVVYGFLTSCKKDFTTALKVIVRVCVLNLDTVNKERFRIEEATGGETM